MSNRFFKIKIDDLFIKSGYETTYSHNQSKTYNHKCSAKRFINYLKTLKAKDCKNCCYYEGCIQYRLNNDCIDECRLEYIQKNINNLIIGEYRLDLVKTEKFKGAA